MAYDLLPDIEKRVGMTAEEMRRATLDELREAAEKKLGHRLTYRVRWPLVGRGNILRDRILSHEDVERILDAALK